MPTVSPLKVSKEKLKYPPLKVHKLGDRVLRQPAKRIAKVNDEVRQLAVQMLQTMYSLDGIGLAAPQVGIPKQLIVIDLATDKPEVPPLILINPEIQVLPSPLVRFEEGCLSVPEVFMEVIRPDRIMVSYRDIDGKPQKMECNDVLARVIQHEMDHLAGILFVDHIQNTIALEKELSQHGFSIKDVQPVR
ncbi:MAG: peptide deformylase [Pseudanabaenaceae cyanobacterium]